MTIYTPADFLQPRATARKPKPENFATAMCTCRWCMRDPVHREQLQQNAAAAIR
jgi:hypothetical protein